MYLNILKSTAPEHAISRCKPMIVTKSTTQKSEFLVPSQFHPQHFPVELPFQLKGISLYAYVILLMLFQRSLTFFSHTQQSTTFSHKTQLRRHVTASSNIPACSCLRFVKPKN